MDGCILVQLWILFHKFNWSARYYCSFIQPMQPQPWEIGPTNEDTNPQVFAQVPWNAKALALDSSYEARA